MNLADPELEFIDPTPNVYSLFMHFDTIFFWTKLAGKAAVRWSKRMYSCAGTCSYERGGICDIALSEPLLKLRPRKDLVETLLHEMIHAYLFIVGKDQSRDGHGPNFLSHMNRINQAARINISIYHDFHDEVKLYQNHIWRCNGRCQKIKPYFGIVRRSMNRAPGPSDYWWKAHMRACGGTFIKCKNPEQTVKPTIQPKQKVTTNGDIKKYINNNNDIKNENKNKKEINNPADKAVKVENPRPVIKPAVFTGSGHAVGRPRSNSVGVLETVRSVWANKTIPAVASAMKKPETAPTNKAKRISDTNSSTLTPPKKIKKIDDYFKTTATSILKDVYGKEFTVTQASDTDKLKAVVVKQTLVECPICNAKVNSAEINKHIDECLNKDVIEKLSKEAIVIIKPSTSQLKSNTTNIKAEKDFKPIKINTDDNLITMNVNTIKPDIKQEIHNTPIKIEPKEYVDLTTLTQIKEEDKTKSNTKLTDKPSTSKPNTENTCPCCGKEIDKTVQEHLDECLMFFEDTDAPKEGDGSIGDRTIVIDDSDDEFDETQTLNATGTKTPCPCCMQMVEIADMNNHLDMCLGLD